MGGPVPSLTLSVVSGSYDSPVNLAMVMICDYRGREQSCIGCQQSVSAVSKHVFDFKCSSHPDLNVTHYVFARMASYYDLRRGVLCRLDGQCSQL